VDAFCVNGGGASGAGYTPGLAISPDGSTLFSSNSGSGLVSKINVRLNARVRIAPYGDTFVSLAALQAVSGWSSAVNFPARMKARLLQIQLGNEGVNNLGVSAGFTVVSVIVGDIATYAALLPVGLAPFPKSGVKLSSGIASITGSSGHAVS
jgi:hypothetical protein